MEMEHVHRLNRDLRQAAKILSDKEARFLVDTYYQWQNDRIRANNQVRAMAEAGEPNSVVNWMAEQSHTLEDQTKAALGKYAEGLPQGVWLMGQTGIGPVLAAGFLSRLEIRPTAACWWKFCGLDPSVTWGKGQKRPWNGALKRLCFLAGESFVKQQGRGAYYGKLYAERKAYETAKNEAGDYADQAAHSLATKNFGADTDARKHYEAGKLPPARIHMRAKRWAVKIFLSHLHMVWFFTQYGRLPPAPFAVAHLHHADNLAPAKMELVPGFEEAFRNQWCMTTDEAKAAGLLSGVQN